MTKNRRGRGHEDQLVRGGGPQSKVKRFDVPITFVFEKSLSPKLWRKRTILEIARKIFVFPKKIIYVYLLIKLIGTKNEIDFFRLNGFHTTVSY